MFWTHLCLNDMLVNDYTARFLFYGELMLVFRVSEVRDSVRGQL